MAAHKHILEEESPVFANLFEKARENGIEIRSILISAKSASGTAIRDILGYVYTKKIELKGVVKAQKLMFVAEKYGLGKLVTTCQTFIRNNMNNDDALELLAAAHDSKLISAGLLKEFVLAYMMEHRKEFASNNRFLDMMTKRPELLTPLFLRLVSPAKRLNKVLASLKKN